MLEVCVFVGALQWALGAPAFTLAWTHSVEKIRWEEDYRLEQGMLVLTAARIRGSGAGMEPPADAVLRDGAWHYTPAERRVPRLLLANSAYGGPYEICVNGACRALPATAESAARPTRIEPCPGQP